MIYKIGIEQDILMLLTLPYMPINSAEFGKEVSPRNSNNTAHTEVKWFILVLSSFKSE